MVIYSPYQLAILYHSEILDQQIVQDENELYPSDLKHYKKREEKEEEERKRRE